MELVAPSEHLVFANPVQFEVVLAEYGELEVLATLSAVDAAIFETFTGRHIGENVDIIICSRTLISPKILMPISSGAFVISGAVASSAMIDILENGCP
ncbi:MAG: hypothetical protein JKY31_09880 [Rhodobacteraceae bacterium]|nr:hypothetical protein [Paracoccaceae bacterium]